MSTEKIYPGGGDTGLHHNLHKRLNLVASFVNLKGKKILDCGCGHGLYLLGFQTAGGNTYGIEYSAEKVNLFREKHPQLADRIINGNLEKIDFENEVFDIAFVNEVLEHVSNEEAALSEIRRVLQPNGLLIVFSPSRYYPFEIHGVYWKANGKKIPHYIPFVPYIPLSVGKYFLNYWARNYWPYELRKKVVKAGFQIIRVGYVWQTFENISGNQPAWLRPLAIFLRTVGNLAEKIPILTALGVSQYIFARKSE